MRRCRSRKEKRSNCDAGSFANLGAMQSASMFSDDSLHPAVRGFLHSPKSPNGDALVLTHSAGSDCISPLLVSFAATFAGQGYLVLRCDLPFRQERRTGPPFPVNAERDRAGLRNAVATLRKSVTGRIFLGGHSYGGRQATMLCASEPNLVSGLRVQHFPDLRTPSLFVHGTRDPFGSVEEMTEALRLLPAKTELMMVEGAGHDLGSRGKARAAELPAKVLARFKLMFG
jgi:predicted alpha/beta-hydrolase family hydrolase